jgi:hypothetical protein
VGGCTAMGNLLERCLGAEEEDDFFVGEPDTQTFREVSSLKAGGDGGGFGAAGQLPPELAQLVANEQTPNSAPEGGAPGGAEAGGPTPDSLGAAPGVPPGGGPPPTPGPSPGVAPVGGPPPTAGPSPGVAPGGAAGYDSSPGGSTADVALS